jgi:AhpC/TSA family
LTDPQRANQDRDGWQSYPILWDFEGSLDNRFESGGNMPSDIREGGTFPDYELADQAGKQRSLSELQGGNAMVLHLSRGGHDPKEHRFLRHLVDAYPDFRNAYPRLVLISTDSQLIPRRRRCHVAIPVGSGSDGPE